ncbi:MAG: hypothetical protein FWC09_03975 [Lachnospiraceae bacterium]|nr:hypothetical protein [Lachnospiraceae bacterium]
MMKRVKKILKSKKAMSYPLGIAIALSIVIISCGAFEYLRLMIIVQGVRDSVQSAIISVSTGNYSEVYQSLREGYSGGYVNEGSGFGEQLNTGNVYSRLSTLLGLKRDGAYYIKYANDDVMEYRISQLKIDIKNAPFTPSDPSSSQKFSAEATIFLEVPLSFGWSNLPPMQIKLNCKAGWIPKF